MSRSAAAGTNSILPERHQSVFTKVRPHCLDATNLCGVALVRDLTGSFDTFGFNEITNPDESEIASLDVGIVAAMKRDGRTLPQSHLRLLWKMRLQRVRSPLLYH